MELMIKLSSSGYSGVALESEELGLDSIDLIREEAGCTLPLNKIVGGIPFVCRYVYVSIPEELARKSQRFATQSTLELLVDKKIMDRLIVKKVCLERSSITGEILSAHIEKRISPEIFIRLWEEAGFPTHRWREGDSHE